MQLYSLVPSAPVVKNITAIDTESVQIEWYMPTDTNGMLSVYTISYTVENGSERNFIVPFNKQNVSHGYINNNILSQCICRSNNFSNSYTVPQ